MAKKELPEDEGPSQEWLASYADAMTLLLAFFIMMFAFALIDEGKFFDFKVGVVAALGVPDPLTDNTDSILSDGTGITPEVGYNPTAQAAETVADTAALRDALDAAGVVTPENAEELKALLENEFERVGASEYVQVGIDERGVFVRFDGRVLFPSNSVELDNDGLTLLATAADVLRVVENLLEVEGHTDNQPTGGEWPSNWELSSARASRVVRWLIESGGLPDPQLMAVGRADTRPRADNSTPEGRQANRRVEIVIRVPGIAESDVDLIGDDPAQIDDAFATDTPETDTADPGIDDPVGLDGAVDPALPTPGASIGSDPATTDPTPADPAAADPSPTDPTATDPAVSDPAATDADLEQPTTTDPITGLPATTGGAP